MPPMNVLLEEAIVARPEFHRARIMPESKPADESHEVLLPKGDWYIIPPVEGDWTVDATPDGRGGQHMRMEYADGYGASVYMRADGTLRVRLYRHEQPHPLELDETSLHVWFRDV